MFLAGTCSAFQIHWLRLREVRSRQPEPRVLKLDAADNFVGLGPVSVGNVHAEQE